MKRLLLVASLLLVPCCTDGPRTASGATTLSGMSSQVATASAYAQLIERLSEPAGYFDTDNLISNETSYLHVMGTLREMNVSGGAYIGVGPDQNFSYIAQVRPAIAFVIDIRRDNLLQHFLFKALFALARNRVEYLSLLFARPTPDDANAWNDRTLQELVDYIDATPADGKLATQTQDTIQELVESFGLPLSEADIATIKRIHSTFLGNGLSLRFTTFNRAPRPYYPTYRQLLLERDLTGRQANYLAREQDFQFLKSLQERNLIIPVVGDLSGDHALAAIGNYLAERGEQVSAFYTSNVEFYLMRQGGFDRFVENAARLPRGERSVVIRSYFGGRFQFSHPQSVTGYFSTQLLQTIESLVEEHASNGYRSYFELVTKHSLDLR
jgi:hypothetical protein